MTERDFPVVRASAYSSIEEQNSKISEEALSYVDAANQNFSGTRLVTRGAALEVVKRALAKVEGETFSVRKHRVLTDLSHYIVLAQRNKVTTLAAENTDLLPLAHPRSTRRHSLTLASILEHRARWYTDDPNITDETVKSLIASALTSHPASPEYEYSIARLEAMPQGTVPQYALVAAFGDGNSSAARRARAMLQRRDRKGRFAEMGGGLRALIRRAKGIFNLNGRVVAQGISGDHFDMELPDGRIARVPAANAESIKAYIPQKSGGDGYSPKPAKASVGDPVIEEADLEFVDAPDGFREDAGWSPDENDRDYYGDNVDLGRKYTDDAYDVIKFEKPNAPAKDKFEIAEQREGEGQNVIAMGQGKDGALDPNLPVYFVNRRDGDDRPFAAVQSWADVQGLIRDDEPRFEKGERPNPNQDFDDDGPAREESSVETPEGEEVEGEVVPALRKPTRRDIRDFERRMKQFEKGKGLFPLDPRKDHLVADDGRVIDLETGEVLFDPRPRRAKVRLAPDQMPKNFYDFNREDKYEPEGATRGQESPDYTDDPAEIAQRFDEQEIKDALRQSVVGNEENPATGVGPLEFEEGDEPVPAEALYEALKEKDAGADEFLDAVYRGPEMSVPQDEQDKLEEVAEIPKSEPEAPKKELPLLEGLDADERAAAEENPAEYLPENKDFDVPEGYAELDKEPFNKDDILVPEEAPDGFNFDPVDIAEKYDGEELKGELRRSLEPGNDMPGFGVLGQEDENGEVYAGRVPGEAIRDALQLQGEDTNEVIDDIYNEGREGQGEPDAQEVQDALEGENVEEGEAEAPQQPAEDKEEPGPAESEVRLPADNETEGGEEAPEGAEGGEERGVGSQEADLEMGEPHRAMVAARDLQPGDIAVRDNEYFVIEEVGDVPDVSNSKDKKKNRIDVKGYYPGHKTQDRNWFANGEIEVIRNVAPPAKGDKDPLPKPELADYGQMMKRDGEWGLRNPEAQARYDADVAAHKAAVQAAGADFFDPTKADADAARIRGEGDAMPEAGPFIAKFRAEDLQPGDIALDNHFKIVEVREGDDGKMVILGHYPGYGLQEKKWKKDTPIEVMRGIAEADGPQVGEGSLHRPAGRGPRGGWYPIDDPALNAEHEERVKEAKNRWQAPEGLPVVSAVDGKGEEKLEENPKPPPKPREPAFPAFQGRFADMAREANGDWGKFKELVDGEEIIVFDFETTGISPTDGNEPYQIAAYKIRNGEIVDKFVMYFNPGRPLKGTYAEKNAVGPDGGPLPEDFFNDKPSQKEALAQFLEWAGENPLLVAQNVKFDDEVFRRKAKELGLDYNPGGLADTMGIAAEMFKDDPDNPGRKNLQALAEYAGVELENWHNAEYDALATAKLFRALLDKAEANNFGVGALDVDARQAEYDAKMAELQPRIDEYQEKLLEFLVNQALRDGLDGKEVDLDEVAKNAEGAGGLPEGPVNEMGALGAPEQVEEPRADLVDVEVDSIFQDGRMKIVDENFYNDVNAVDALMRGEIKVDNLRPGDFVRPNRDRPEFFQVVSIRGGDEFGVEEFKRRVVVQNKNGEQKVVFWNQNAFLDEVRRPKDRRDLVAGDGEKTAAEEVAEATAKPVEIQDGETKAVPVPFSNIKAVIRRDGDEFEAVIEGQNARGEQERFNANFRDERQARDWAAVVANVMNRDMKAARDGDDEKSVAVGEEPANVNELPVVEQIDDLPFGRGENEVVPRVEDEEVVYNSKAKVIDDEGEVQAQVEEDFPNLPDALEGGRDNAEQAAQALADQIAEQREGLLLRTEGRGRKNLPPIPDEYRRQVYIRLLAGLYADENGNPLAIGDRVVHRRPEMAQKYGEGVVVGKVQGKIGGLQRKGVVYVDYVRVQYPNGEIRKFATRFQRHVDPDVAKERFDAEPRINWMNEQEMAEALEERAKKPRKEKEGEAEAVEKAAEDIREAVAPEFESVQDFNIDWFLQNGNRQKIAAGDIKEGDYIPTKGDRNIGRVVNVEDLDRAVQIEVEYPDGRRWAYRPMAKGFEIDAYRLDGEAPEAPEAPQAPEAEAPEAEAPQAPEAPAADGDRPVPVPRIEKDEDQEANALREAEEAAELAKQKQAVIDEVLKEVRALGPQNQASNYRKRDFIKAMQDIRRGFRENNEYRIYSAHASAVRRLDRLVRYDGDNPDYQRYRELLDKVQPFAVRPQRQRGGDLNNEGLAPFAGPPLEEFDPISVREQRIADGVNAPKVNDFWKGRLLPDTNFEELARKGTDVRKYKEEIQKFFAGEPKPLAELSEGARFALEALVADQLLNPRKGTEEKNAIRGLVELAEAIHLERLAFEPNDGKVLDARGAQLRNFSPEEMSAAAANGGVLVDSQGQNTGFRVQGAGAGGGRNASNKIYLVTDLTTGKRYIFKKDTAAVNVEAELLANDLMRALNVHGLYPAEAHENIDNVIIMGHAGQNMKFKNGAPPKNAYKEIGDGAAAAEAAPPMQNMRLMLVDAILHNNDRHLQNWMLGVNNNDGQNIPGLKFQPLIIDNGLAGVIDPREEQLYGVMDAVSYMRGKGGRNRSLHRAMMDALGQKGFYEAIQVSLTQAIQVLRRQYPPGANPNMDKLIARAEEIRDADISDWR